MKNRIRLTALTLAVIILLAGCNAQPGNAPQSSDILVMPPATTQAAPPSPALAHSPLPPASTPEPIPAAIVGLIAEAERLEAEGEVGQAEQFYWDAVGTAPAYGDAYIRLASLLVARGERQEALRLLERGVFSRNGSREAGNAPLVEAWYAILTDYPEEETPPLTQEELLNLADMAYVGFNPCMISMQELSKDDLLFAPYIYYSLWTNYSYNDKTGNCQYNRDLSYPAKAVLFGVAEYAAVTAKQTNTLVKDLFGREIPDLYEPYGDIEDDRFFSQDDMYYFFIGDYLMYAHFVEGYRYLGDGYYYIIFGEDWLSSAGFVEEPVGPNDLHLIVRRSTSAWGFTQTAILKNGEYTILTDNCKPLNGITWVEDAQSGFPSYRGAEQREEDMEAFTW